MYKEGYKKIFHSKSKTFTFYCFCFLIGVAVASVFDIRLSPFVIYISGISLALIVFLSFRLARFKISNSFWIPPTPVVRMTSIILFGVVRYAWLFPANTSDQIQFYAPNKVELAGTIIDEPDVRIDGVRYTIEASSLELKGGNQKVSGWTYAKYDLYPRFQYGDEVKVNCTLQIPKPIEDKTGGQAFRYDLYLARYHIFSTCEHPWIEKVDSGGGSQIFAWMLQGKNFLATKITALWPEPDASFMAGLLYGYRGGLGKLNDLFSRTGVTHIVAISGFNITVIATILINLCVYLCVPRQKAFWFVSIGIVLFVIFTGASASVVRAGVMGIIALLAKYVGRVSRIGNVLLLAAVTMALQNPLVLMFDAGFQLSFLSTLGLVYLSPCLEKYGKYFPEFASIRENILSTASAILMTLPLILYQFGRLSIVSPIVNIAILWIIPWLMIAGVAAVITGILYWPIGQWVAWVGWIGMEYAIGVVRWFAHLPFAAIDIQIPAWGMILGYTILIFIIYRYRRVNFNNRI